METFELRYFLGVARTENIHRAAEDLHVSPGSLSKAISRLEEELSVKLFSRDGRNIKLTEHGRLLQLRASQLIQLEEATRLELAGAKGTIHVHIAGSEMILAHWGLRLSETIKEGHPRAQFEYQSTDEKTAWERVERGEAHVALTTDHVPVGRGLSSKVIGEATFKTFVGGGHPLRKRKTVSVDELLTHSFVSTNRPLFGKVGAGPSLDGWRDDKFPRRVDYLTSSQKVLEQVVTSGKAVAYLPDYLGLDLGLVAVEVLGCPFVCRQKIKLVVRNPKELTWLDWS